MAASSSSSNALPPHHPESKPSSSSTNPATHEDDPNLTLACFTKQDKEEDETSPTQSPLGLDDGNDVESTKGKRKAPQEQEEDKKKKKTKKTKKKNPIPFQRLWTLDDEITVLESIVTTLSASSTSEMGKGKVLPDPFSSLDMASFHKDIAPLLSRHGITQKLLRDKIHKLRGKYMAYAQKTTKLFTDPKEQKVHDLCKLIWGNTHKSTRGNGHPERNSKFDPKKQTCNLDPKEDSFPFFEAAMEKMQHGTLMKMTLASSLIDHSRLTIIEDKYRRIWIADAKNKMHEMDLMKETIKLIMDAAGEIV